MKKVVNGLLYNTETANEIASDGYSNRGDFAWWDESLYKTKKGNYFLVGEGGPLSKYREPCGNNNWSGSKRMEVLTEEEAYEWLERHNCSDVILEHFSEKIREA